MLPPAPARFDYNAVPASLRGELKAEAASIRAQVKFTVLTIIKTGQALTAVKGKLEHGQFSAWVEAECGFTLRTAENYIRAAAFAEGKSETVALLPPAVLYKLAAKTTPEPIVAAVMDRLSAGEVVTGQEVSAAVAHVRWEKREAERKAREAARRPVSKRTKAKREAERKALEEQRARDDEKVRATADNIVAKLGVDSVSFILNEVAATGLHEYRVFSLLKEIVDTSRTTTPASTGVAHRTKLKVV